MSLLYSDIISMFRNFHFSFTHILQEVNSVTDQLVRHSVSIKWQIIFRDKQNLPTCINAFIHLEQQGLPYLRV